VLGRADAAGLGGACGCGPWPQSDGGHRHPQSGLDAVTSTLTLANAANPERVFMTWCLGVETTGAKGASVGTWSSGDQNDD
jgi:hypothetical protein